jgi:hypothetical protein
MEYLHLVTKCAQGNVSSDQEQYGKVHTAFNLPYAYDYITKLCSNKQKPHKIMRMNTFAAQGKAKPDIENIGGLNLAAVKLTTVQVTKLLL